MNRGYPKQRQITGRTPETYQWVDRRPARAAQPRVVEASFAPRTGEGRARRLDDYIGVIGKTLMYATLVFVVLVLFIEFGKLSDILDRVGKINVTKKENVSLMAEVENLQVEIDMELRPEIIKQSAGDLLKMREPSDASVIMLQAVRINHTEDATQTAEGLSGGR